MHLFKRNPQKQLESSTTALIMSSEEMEDIMKIVKPLEESGLLIKEISETIKNVAKKKGRFLGLLIGTLASSFLASALTRQVIRAGEGVIRESQNF